MEHFCSPVFKTGSLNHSDIAAYKVPPLGLEPRTTSNLERTLSGYKADALPIEL